MAVIRVKTDYPTIQAAVDASSDGDIILVEAGVYSEQVSITKNYIKIIGEGEVVLDGKFLLDYGFLLINATGVKIESFRIVNFRIDGVYVSGGSYNVLAKNRIANNNYIGIELYNTSHTQINANAVEANYYGIYVYSLNDRIDNNRINNNGYVGIYVSFNEAATEIVKNQISENYYYGVLCYGNYCRISNNRFCGNNYGIYLYANGTVQANEVSENRTDGIYLSSGNNNTLVENKVYANNQNGISASGSYNTILRNEVKRNKLNGLLLSAELNTVRGNILKENQLYDFVRRRPNNYLSHNICETSNPPGLCHLCSEAPDEAEEAE